MSPRTGRPKSDKPKELSIKVRFDKELNTKLVRYSEDNGITRAEVIRTALTEFLDKNKK